jgi:hypothetical protein
MKLSDHSLSAAAATVSGWLRGVRYPHETMGCFSGRLGVIE